MTVTATTAHVTAITSRVTGKATAAHRITARFSDGRTVDLKTTKTYPFLLVDAFIGPRTGEARSWVVMGTASRDKAKASYRRDTAYRHILEFDKTTGTYADWTV